MSATGGIEIDTRQFQKAMLEYQEATKKTFADVANRAVQNLGFKGWAATKEAESHAIQIMERMEWWPKYIAKILSGKKRSVIAAKIKKGIRVRNTQPHYTREQARAFSKQIIRKRLVAIRFLKYFWAMIGSAAAKAYKGGRSPAIGKKFGGFSVTVRPATMTSPMCQVTTRYPYRRRSNRTAKRTEALLRQVVPAAYAAAADDMMKFARNKMDADAKRHSAR